MSANNGARPGEHPERGPEHRAESAVTGLAREVAALRERLLPLIGVDEQLTALANTVTELAGEVGQLVSRAGNSAGAPSWLDLPDGSDGAEPLDVDSVRALLGELAVWVERIYLRYADAAKSFPECWLYHPDVVEELTWLRHAWWRAYQAEGAGPGLSWDWHDRYRPGVVRRVNLLAGRCSLDQHTDSGSGTAPTACGLAGLDELATWWATDRHAGPPPPSAAVLEQARDAETARLRQGGRR